MELIILFFISIPIFYIYGVVVFLRNIFGKKNTPTPSETSLSAQKAIITELTIKVAESPNKTIKELLAEYLKRTGVEPVTGFTQSHTELLSATKPDTTAVLETKEIKRVPPKEDFFSTWYSNNSINLLLYIGAFLIISASGIFVSFQWETMPGTIKALLLTTVGGAFFGFGWYFYSLPKIRNAGVTFIGIAAILIPVIGSAWYTFVMKDAGIPAGIAWMLTSVVALTAYVSLALYMRTAFYAYASTISTFSLMLSVVNSFDLNKNFYLLAGIVACFILMGMSYFISKQSKQVEEIFSIPTDLSSQIAMPIILLYGFATGLSEQTLFSFEGTLSAFLAASFYAVGYMQTKETWKFALTEILFLLSILFGCNWFALSELTTYYIISLTGLSYAALAYQLLTTNQTEEADASFVIGTTATIIVFLVAFFSDILPIHQAFLALFPITTSLLTAYLKKNPYPLLVTSSFFALFLYIVYAKILGFSNYPEYLGLLYLIQAVARYMLTFSLGKKKETLDVGHITIVSYSVLALFLTYDHAWLFIIVTSVISFMLFSTSLLQKTKLVSIGGVFFALISVLVLFSELHTPDEFYPFIILLFSYLLFFIGRMAPVHLMEELRASSLLISTLSSLFFYSNRFDVYPNTSHIALERNALISAYGTTILFAIDYVINAIKPFGYVTSFIALCTLLWHINYLGFTDTLMYTTPIGLYFLGVAYVRGQSNDLENQKLLNAVGALFLLAPPFFLSFGDNATKYSIILFLESALFVFAGISLTNLFFRYAGVAGIVLAILPQTYNYIMALPRWVVVGILGMAFLTFAIFLLLKRKEE